MSRSYRNISVKSPGKYPKKVGKFKVVKTKVRGKVAWKITGFAKKPAKILFREDKAAEFMRRRAKEAKAFRNNPDLPYGRLVADGIIDQNIYKSSVWKSQKLDKIIEEINNETDVRELARFYSEARDLDNYFLTQIDFIQKVEIMQAVEARVEELGLEEEFDKLI